MERVFKIRTKTNADPRGLYPSERRYSASIVIGLSVVYLQLFLYSVLMGTLIIHKMAVHRMYHSSAAPNGSLGLENDTTTESSPTAEDTFVRLHERIEKDLAKDRGLHYYINVPALVCVGCFVMALGSIFSFATGVLAWRRWYIDHNITFFFLASSFSTLTSAVCLMLSVLSTVHINFEHSEVDYSHLSPVTLSLAVNIIILSSVGVIWSFLSTKVAFKGMKSSYPDDMVISKGGGRIQVSTVTKGNLNCSTLPPDIINQFPVTGKLAKYLPRKDNSNLPKAESNYEYQERVNRFLSGEPENTDGK